MTPSVARRHAYMNSSRAASFLFLYKLLDIATWIKYNPPVVVTVPRGDVLGIDIPVSSLSSAASCVHPVSLGLVPILLELFQIYPRCFQYSPYTHLLRVAGSTVLCSTHAVPSPLFTVSTYDQAANSEVRNKCPGSLYSSQPPTPGTLPPTISSIST
jgi:hypothetical protein